MVKANAEFCPDCGAPITHDDAPTEGSDAAIYPELARANLLRMRGEFKQAEDICLSILRRFPNNATANGLLGDMKAEQGDLEQAAEWYELALDLVDDSGVKAKLHQVKKRIQDREAANTAKQIGLPSGKPKMGLFIVAALVLIVCSAGAAYVLGQKSQVTSKTPRTTIDDPLNIPRTTTGSASNSSEEEGDPSKGETAPVQAPASVKAEVDRALLNAIARENPLGSKLIDAFQDPRSKDITLTFVATESDDLRNIAAELGKSALTLHLESNRIILRGIMVNQISLVADMTREAYRATDSQEWKDAHRDDAKAFANAVLSNVWPPQLQGETSRGETATPPESGDASGQPLNQGN